MESKRRLAAIMFTDIVGYTALMGKDSYKALELVRINRDIQKPLVEKHGGKWLKEMGDGAMAQFNTALDAVNCAVEIQRTSRADFDADLRIGIHLGDITIENNDVYGDGVNVAARLEYIADPGGIYISESIEKAIQGQTDIQAKYLGEVKLKNVAYGVRTYAVQGVGLPVPQIKEHQHLKGHFWAEVQRRGVVRTGATYLVLSVLAVLLLPYAESIVNLPDWAATALLTILIAGFPLAMYLAWNYERSPEGFVRTTSQQSWQNPYKGSQRKPLTSNVIIVVMALILVGMYLYPRYLSGDESEKFLTTNKSIAVLPFTNESSNKENMYFCNGIMEGVLDHLAKIPELRVLSRSSVEQYRNDRPSMKEMADELGVMYLVEGSVQRIDDRAIIFAQLIHAESDKHLWSSPYERNLTDIFAIQAEITQSIADELKAVIAPDVMKRIEAVPTSDQLAYDYYLQGNEFLNKIDRRAQSNNVSQELSKNAELMFHLAITRDSNFAEPYLSLAKMMYKKRILDLENQDSTFILINKALELNSDLSDALILRGATYASKGKDLHAKVDWERAYEMKPNDVDVLHNLSNSYLTIDVDFKRSLQLLIEIQHREKSPEGIYKLNLALWDIFMRMGHVEMEEIFLEKCDSLKPNAPFWGYLWYWIRMHEPERVIEEINLRYKIENQFRLVNLGNAHLYLGDYAEALHFYEKWEELVSTQNANTGLSVGDWHRYGQSLLELGYEEKGREMMEKQIEIYHRKLALNSRAFSTMYNLAGIYAYLEEKDKAYEWLARYVDQDGWLRDINSESFIQVDPLFDAIRNDTRFKQILNDAISVKTKIREELEELVNEVQL